MPRTLIRRLGCFIPLVILVMLVELCRPTFLVTASIPPYDPPDASLQQTNTLVEHVPPTSSGTPRAAAGKQVVVLVHGWHGMPGEPTNTCSAGPKHYPEDGLGDFGEMTGWIAADGFDVWMAQLDTGPNGTPSIEHNAWDPGCLMDQIAAIKKATCANTIILIADSMGGLVSRAYIESDFYRNDVSALYTIGTPHGGVPADVFAILLPGSLSLCTVQVAACQFSRTGISIFNAQFSQRAAGVDYMLIGGDKTPIPVGTLLQPIEDTNDGIVGVYSGGGYYHDPIIPGVVFNTSPAVVGERVQHFMVSATHTASLGHPTYFEPDASGYSETYNCMRYYLTGSYEYPCRRLVVPARPQPAGDKQATSLLPLERGHIAADATQTHTFRLDTGDAARFSLSWQTGTLTFTITTPDGTIVSATRAGTAQVATADVSNTTQGVYTMTITSGKAGTDYVAAAMLESPRTLAVALDAQQYAPGSMATITATLTGAAGAISTATLTATVEYANMSTATLAFVERQPGIYTAAYRVPDLPGYAMLWVQSSGSDGGTRFDRQALQLIMIESQAVQIGAITADRIEQQNLAVDVPVQASQPGEYVVSAKLAAGNSVIASTVTTATLKPGSQTLTLYFDGQAIQASGQNGPFTVTDLVVTDKTRGSIPVLAKAQTGPTAPYRASQFGGPKLPVPAVCGNASQVYLPVVLQNYASGW